MLSILFFLSSGLFLGWSLGANDAANIFGTAVGTKMLKFRTAALICSFFIIIGAVISGMGASHTLGQLGQINELPGAFIVALCTAITVLWMTKIGLPVSISQAVVGAIIGWNFFSGKETDFIPLTKIIYSWLFSPLLSAFFAFFLYFILKFLIEKSKIHLLKIDFYFRIAFILVGAFGAYSLGANNIGNVMGIFIPSAPFNDLYITESIKISSVQQLFLLGGIFISLGVFTYSKKVMTTVGCDLFKLSPATALIVVLSSSLTLFLFASENLFLFLSRLNLPTIPLVPVSSSQSVIGAIIGISFAKGMKGLNYNKIIQISIGWIVTPLIAALICYISLFFMQNVFMQVVYR